MQYTNEKGERVYTLKVRGLACSAEQAAGTRRDARNTHAVACRRDMPARMHR